LNTPHGADVYRRFKRILYGEQDSLVTALEGAVLRNVPALQRGRVRLCDIGGGDGDRIARIVKLLHDRYQNSYDLNFVEQSHLYVHDFARRATPSYLDAHIHCGRFEDISLPAGVHDAVFVIHSIFAFGDDAAIEKVLRLVCPGGCAIVVSNAADSFLAGLKRLIDAGFSDARYEITNLVTALQERAEQFAPFSLETIWEIRRERWAADVAIILDWISLGRYASLSADTKQEIDAYLHDMSKPTSTGRRFTETEIVLVVPPVEFS